MYLWRVVMLINDSLNNVNSLWYSLKIVLMQMTSKLTTCWWPWWQVMLMLLITVKLSLPLSLPTSPITLLISSLPVLIAVVTPPYYRSYREEKHLLYVELFTILIYSEIHCAVIRDCRIHWLYLCKCPEYDFKQSDGEAPEILELWGMGSTSLPLLPGPLWPRVVTPERVLSMGQIELFDI